MHQSHVATSTPGTVIRGGLTCALLQAALPGVKTLILGTAYGSRVVEVRPFVESLRRYYQGEVQLLVNTFGPEDLIPYLREWKIIPRCFDSAAWMVSHIQVTRYLRYWELLRESATQYDRILLTDVTDVLFQADPFIGAPPGELLVFLEDERAAISGCESNSFWVREFFGAEVLARLARCPISCSGTTMGTHGALLEYLPKLMFHAQPERLTRLPSARGYDQGIHNYLLHTGALPQARAVPNGDWIYTLGHVPPREIVLSSTGLLTAEGRRSPIVHQWTYHPAVAEWVRARPDL